MQVWVDWCIWKAGMLQIAAGSKVQLLTFLGTAIQGDRLPHFNHTKTNNFITNAAACAKEIWGGTKYSKLKHIIVLYLIYISATTVYENVVLLKTNYCIKPFNWLIYFNFLYWKV